MNPTIGGVVIYNTTEEEQERMREMQSCNVQAQLPAVIVAVWPTSVNLSVILDGQGTLWATSRHQGDEPGQWNWPVIQR